MGVDWLSWSFLFLVGGASCFFVGFLLFVFVVVGGVVGVCCVGGVCGVVLGLFLVGSVVVLWVFWWGLWCLVIFGYGGWVFCGGGDVGGISVDIGDKLSKGEILKSLIGFLGTWVCFFQYLPTAISEKKKATAGYK